VDVTSTFSQGRFTQELNGVLLLFDLPANQTSQPQQTQKAVPAPQSKRGSTNTARIQHQPQGALGATPGVEFAGSEFGAYFGTGETGGAVNYKPTGLAQVLDRQQPQRPLTGDSLGAEGFGDPTAASTPPAPIPPTSSGQPVGPAASGSAAVRSQGGASGRAVGLPVSVQVFTRTGIVEVTTQAGIQRLFNEGRITALERTEAGRELSLKQGAGSSPTTNQPRQPIARDF
jgi:hypothetical protein